MFPVSHQEELSADGFSLKTGDEETMKQLNSEQFFCLNVYLGYLLSSGRVLENIS